MGVIRIPKTKISETHKPVDYAWFRGHMSVQMRFAGIDQKDLPDRSVPTWRAYLRDPKTMDLKHFVMLMDATKTDKADERMIIDMLLEDIRKELGK